MNEKHKQIVKIFKIHNGYARSKDILAKGIHPRDIKATMEKGLIIKGYKIRIYCMEKTICDCIRYRNKLGLDVTKEGLSEYLKRKNRNLEKLLEYAEICRVKPLLQTWLNVMV